MKEIAKPKLANMRHGKFDFLVRYDDKHEQYYASCEHPPFGSPIYCHGDTLDELNELMLACIKHNSTEAA